MGFPGGGINISSNFQVNVALPLDQRAYVNATTDRDNIAFKYSGMKVYVYTTDTWYTLSQDLTTWSVSTATVAPTVNLRGDFICEASSCNYPTGLASNSVGGHQTGNGSGAGNTIKAGDAWLIGGINSTMGSISVITGYTVIALVDNAANLDNNWVIQRTTTQGIPRLTGYYLVPIVSDNAIANGADLKACYNSLSVSTPGGSPLSASNRATLIVMPGLYDFNSSPLVINTNFVDIIGLGDAKDVIFTASTTGTDIIHYNTNINNVKIKNIGLAAIGIGYSFFNLGTDHNTVCDIENMYIYTGATFGADWYGKFKNVTSLAGYLFTGSLGGDNTNECIIQDCTSTTNSFGYVNLTGNGILTIGAKTLIKNCKGTGTKNFICLDTNVSFGTSLTITVNFNGTIQDCSADTNSFGYINNTSTNSSITFNTGINSLMKNCQILSVSTGGFIYITNPGTTFLFLTLNGTILGCTILSGSAYGVLSNSSSSSTLIVSATALIKDCKILTDTGVNGFLSTDGGTITFNGTLQNINLSSGFGNGLVYSANQVTGTGSFLNCSSTAVNVFLVGNNTSSFSGQLTECILNTLTISFTGILLRSILANSSGAATINNIKTNALLKDCTIKNTSSGLCVDSSSASQNPVIIRCNFNKITPYGTNVVNKILESNAFNVKDPNVQ